VHGVFELPLSSSARSSVLDQLNEPSRTSAVPSLPASRSADCIAAVSGRVSLWVVRLENPGFAPTHPLAPTNKTPRFHPPTDPGGAKISAFLDVGSQKKRTQLSLAARAASSGQASGPWDWGAESRQHWSRRAPPCAGACPARTPRRRAGGPRWAGHQPGGVGRPSASSCDVYEYTPSSSYYVFQGRALTAALTNRGNWYSTERGQIDCA
jgi:hypothetical protein